MNNSKPIACFKYRNHRGEVANRTIIVDAVEFIRNPGFDYQSGWFVSGHCLKKKARRSFALANIVMDTENVPPFFLLLKF